MRTPSVETPYPSVYLSLTTAFAERLDTIMDNQREVRPHFLCRVPQFFTGDLGRIVAERYRDVLASLYQEVLSKESHAAESV